MTFDYVGVVIRETQKACGLFVFDHDSYNILKPYKYISPSFVWIPKSIHTLQKLFTNPDGKVVYGINIFNTDKYILKFTCRKNLREKQEPADIKEYYLQRVAKTYGINWASFINGKLQNFDKCFCCLAKMIEQRDFICESCMNILIESNN